MRASFYRGIVMKATEAELRDSVAKLARLFVREDEWHAECDACCTWWRTEESPKHAADCPVREAMDRLAEGVER